MTDLFPQIFDIWDNLIDTFVNDTDVLEVYKKANCVYSHCSCGVTVLSGVSYAPPQDIVHKVLYERHPKDFRKTREAFVIFSDVERGTAEFGGNSLYNYIKDNNLGAIQEFGPRMNPNTENMIKVWIWEPPHESLRFNDRQMEVHGKTIEKDHLGRFVRYIDDKTEGT